MLKDIFMFEKLIEKIKLINVAGNPLKWVCDTAGTPGTWRAIYTIETQIGRAHV